MLVGRGARWEYPLGFLLLALSHFATIIAVQDIGTREALAAYTASSSLALAGFIILFSPIDTRRMYVALPLLVPLTYDLATAVIGAAASLTRFSGTARHLVLAIALTHTLRAVGALLLPGEAGALLVMVAELLRAMFAAMLATYYAVTIARGMQ